MPPKKASHNLDNKVVESILLHTDPNWDSSPIRMPGWFALLLKDIPKQNAAFDSLLRFGYVATSRGVACTSAAHAAAFVGGHSIVRLSRFRQEQTDCTPVYRQGHNILLKENHCFPPLFGIMALPA